MLADYLEIIELVEPVESPRVARDPDDDQVLAAALSARADVMVSGDADLLILGSFQNIRILAPRDALAMLAERSGLVWLSSASADRIATGSATDSEQSPNKPP